MVKRAIRTVAAALAFLFLAAPALAQDSMVEVTAKPSKAAVIPGEQFAIAVVFEIAEGWHINPSEMEVPPELEGWEPILTNARVTGPEGVRAWATQWPVVHQATVQFGSKPAEVDVFDGRAVAYIPVQAPEDAAAGTPLVIELEVVHQACNETTCMLDEVVPLRVEVPVVTIEQQAATPPVAADPDFGDFDQSVFAGAPLGAKGAASSAAKPIKINAFGIVKFELNPQGAGFVLLLLVAALGGFLLNFTPCVLPVLPLKIMGISAASGHPAKCLYLGTVMSLGVVAFWLAIGAAIAFISGFTAINSLFQTPWFSIGVGLFILIMAVGMLGAFAVQLPKAVYMVNPSHETAPGSFLFGIMTAVLSTPCTAPFMGSAAAWAATQNPVFTLATFGAIGAGMALPYLILSAFPGWLKKVPRTGPASELIKQVMGLLLIAVAIFFLGTGIDPMVRLPIDPPVRFFWWIIGATAVAAMLWLMYRTFRISRKPVVRAVWTGFAMLFAALSVMVAIHFTDRGPIPWVGYTPERLSENLGKNKVVVMDFTAEWCINCKAMEAAVLHRDEIVELLTHPDVVPMKVDLTGNNVDGKRKLKELNWVGIPLLAIYGPGVTEPIKYDAYTPEMVKEAIARAGGPALTAPLARATPPATLGEASQTPQEGPSR